MEPIGRRSLLIGTAAAVAALRMRSGLVSAPAARAAPRIVDDPFTLGVATGDPSTDGFVAWTRLAPDPTGGGGMAPDPVAVGWEVAADPGFGSIVQAGTTTALAELAHTVHVEVGGLAPDSEWWVRFAVPGHTSAAARGRTLPSGGRPDLRFAFVSCQSYATGYYTALRGVADERCDLWFHLGDYIYENSGNGPVRPFAASEVFTLEEYRNRYGQYKTDPDLRAAHASAPCVPVWDDHEVDNDYADEVGENGQTPAQILARRTAGYRAWFEHLPVRLGPPTGPDLQIYRRLAWGDLATIHMLDGRQYRDEAPCGGALTDCPERTEVDRTMLGAEQRAWLAEGVASSAAVWDVVGQQTVFSPMPVGTFYNNDQWDGYPQDRQRVWEILRQRPNPVVITGDIHAAGVARLHQDLLDPESPRIGTELVGTSVSSSFDPALVEPAEALIGQLPTIEYINARQRGYTVVSMSAERMVAEYKVVADATRPDSAISTAFVYEVEARVATEPPAEPPPPPGEGQPPTAPPADPISADASFTG